MYKFYSKILITATICLSATFTHAQSAADILDRMIQEYSNSISGIETMMVITKMEGFLETDEPDTTYYRKVQMEDGSYTMQEVGSARETPSADYYNFKANYDAIVNNASYEGTESIDGRNAHVLLIEDISALYNDAVAGVEQADESAEAQRGRLYIDASDYVLLRMSFEMQFEEEFSGSIDMNMKDYRDVDGMKYPFLIEMVYDGISDQFSAEELAEAQKGLREAREQIDNASGMQRRILERTLRGTIERLETMLEEGGMSMRMVTQAVETNVSIPD